MAKASLSVNEVRDMMLAAADKIIESEPILTDADRALGDGDHGVGMERGMTAVKEALAGKDFPSAGKVFVAVGTAMMSSMGGASGAIFGILFRSGGKAVGDVTEFTAAGLASLLREGTDQVMTKGAKPGDKTMVDALFPAAAKAAEVSGEPVDEALAAVAAAVPRPAAAVVSTDERFITFLKLRLEFVAKGSFEAPSATIADALAGAAA